eukprot:gb/GECG01001160.1/.p1 GENE.gb/GECG01001160.1/~~gb/GECG01001160.1/.p1  ORF type:complete len:176 (+),score=18.40 gb/GECG01001160.1/:1-528(+)
MTEHEEETSTRPPPGKGKGGPGFGFQCKLTSSRVLVDGLSALHFGKKDQFASFTVNNVGLRVSVQNVAKTMHAVMYIKANVFDDFDPPVQEQSRHEEDDGEPEIRFSVNLGNLLECLRVFGSNVVDMTTVELKYHEMTGCDCKSQWFRFCCYFTYCTYIYVQRPSSCVGRERLYN